MTAARLRKAAKVLRDEAHGETLARWDLDLALADWLDTAGSDLWAYGPLCECGSGCMSCDDSIWQPHARRALAVADLILGGERP